MQSRHPSPNRQQYSEFGEHETVPPGPRSIALELEEKGIPNMTPNSKFRFSFKHTVD
jgi:hypothetical protein